METFFMNTKNSKTNEPNRFKYDLIDKLDLKNPNKNLTLGNLRIYYTWKNVKSTYNNNKFKISATTWNETFDLPDGSYNISEIQDYIEYIIKKQETIGENAPILIYANTINNRIVFKIKSGYKLELLSKETMKLLGSTKDIIDLDKNSENVPSLENVEVVLVHCNLVNNSYQQASRVLFTFVPTKQYGQLISISPHSLVFLKTINTEFSEIEVWFTDQNNNALTRIHGELIEDADDLDIVMPMYNLLEHSKNYRKTIGSLYNYYRDELNDDADDNNFDNIKLVNSNTFKYKNKIIGNTYDVDAGAKDYDVNKNGTQEVELAIPLKYLGKN